MDNHEKLKTQRHPKSNREMALQISNLCDAYWENKLTELQLINDLQHFFITYPELVWDENGQANGTVVHKLGKKRLKLIHKIVVNMQLEFSI